MSTKHRSVVTCLAIICLVTSVQFIPSVLYAGSLRLVTPDPGDTDGGQWDPEWRPTPKMFIEPIAGMTTVRHPAPARTAICAGVEVTLCQEVPVGGTVTWGGASEAARIDDESFATKVLTSVGEQVIVAVVETQDGRVYENRVVFDIVDISLDEIQMGQPTVEAQERPLSEWMTNEETYQWYAVPESIAQLRKVSLERQSFETTFDGRFGKPAKALPTNPVERYRTSVARTLHFGVSVDPPGFLPLIEWRVGNEAPVLGATVSVTAEEPGIYNVSVGPPTRARQIELETYSVTITSHITNHDIVGEGEAVVFEAVTDPPGYEADITWLSSTKYGTASPVLGQGPAFTVQFDDTLGLDGRGAPFQWLGVKAGNTTFNQDQKVECGVRIEGGLHWAFIGHSNGQELVAVSFDPKTETEDYETQRFFGLTESELQSLEDIGDPGLLLDPLTVQAARLWLSSPPCNGTPGELAIVNRQSQLLSMMVDATGASNPEWKTNGCSFVPDFDFEECCNRHDICYCIGGDAAARLSCDQELRDWIADDGFIRGILAGIYYAGVRAFGGAFFNTQP